jgi:hypothetical protein
MASTKYIGYVGGVAVAVGVGAAIAAAGQGTANADATDGGSAAKDAGTSTSVNAGPKRSAPGPAKALSKINDNVAKVSAQVTKTAHSVSASISDSLAKPAAKPVTKVGSKPTPSPADFEAKQVDRLKKMFEPRQAAAQHTAPKPDSSVDAPVSRAAVQADTPAPTAAPAWSPNPFRTDDPTPTNEPELVQQLSSTLIGITPEALQPFTREGVEAGYRVSQMVPWLNIVVPATKIIPNLSPALQSGDDGARARQVIVNQLLITTQPGSIAFYGYDEVADLLNVEHPADDLKQQAFVTAWNILDPFHLAHVPDESGIDRTYAV